MADFTHESNYTEETSFSKVVFGSSAPVLEVELNELQEITDTKLKRIHDVIGKYVYVRGSFNTNSSGNTHQVTITDCTIIFNGFSAYVDSMNTVVTISGPVNVYFEIIKGRVTGDTALYKYGNTTRGVTIENPIYDSRLGSETSQREQVKINLRFSSQSLEDTDNTVYIHIGLFIDGVFNKSDCVFDKTIVDLIDELSTNKLNTTDFTTNNITGTLSIAKGGTGATDRGNAFKNLSFETYTCTTLSGDGTYYTDLDNMKTAGNYFVQKPNDSTANITTVSIANGWLVVIPSGGNGTKQILYRYGSTSTHHQIFVRTCFTNTWSDWVRIFDSMDTIPIENGGTGATTKSDAITNLVYNDVQSTDSKNLNDYITPAINYFSGNTAATSNTPSGNVSIGSLIVIAPRSSIVCQMWIDNSTNARTYIRMKYGGSWGSWGKIFNTNNVTNYSTPTALNNCVVSNCHIYKKSGWVQLTGYITVQPTSTSAATIQAGQVADEFLPFETSRGVAYRNLGNNTFKQHPIEVHATGKIQIQEIVGVASGSSYATQNIYLSICYPAKND